MSSSESEAQALALLAEGPRARPVPLPATGALVVGSDPARAGLVLDAAGVLPAHLVVAKVKGGGWGAVGVEGAPFEVNGAPAQSVRLGPGDRIQLGAARLAVVAHKAQVQHKLPERLAGFRLRRRLGSGAMGQVWLAEQESLGREVALKVLRPELAEDASFVRRFAEEARAAAALGHANVVTVHDVGQDQGFHFLAMEYMPGGSLEERLTREGPLAWALVLDAMLDAARGLEYAERRGLVHRDIKPANLMLSADGGVKIADLGLAVAEAAEGRAEDPAGRPVVGTPHFMAPEQARGEALDSRADLYALGASAYRLLSGRTPHSGIDSRSILRAVLTEPPAPLAAMAPNAPPALVTLVERLLSKDPGARAPGAAAFVRELEALKTTLASGGGAAAAGRRLPLVPLAIAAAVLAGAGYWFTRPDRTEEAPAPRAELPAPADGETASPERDPQPGPTAPRGTAAAPPAEIGAEDALLRELERRAGEALARAESLADPEERAAALRALITAHAGSDAAREAEARLGELFPAGDDPGDESQRLAGTRALLLAELAAALGQPRPAGGGGEGGAAEDGDGVLSAPAPAPGTPPLPGALLAALEGFLVPPELATDESFLDAFDALLERWSADAEARIAGDLARADETFLAGDLDAHGAALAAFLAFSAARPEDETPQGAETAAETPELAPGTRTADSLAVERGFDPVERLDLAGRIARAEAALAALSENRAERANYLAQEDRRHLGRALGVQSAFAAELLRGETAAAAARVRGALGELRTDEARAGLGETLRYLEAAAAAPRLAADTFRAGEWRRRNVPLPGRRRLMAEALLVDAAGMTVQTGGAEERVPWSAFAGSTADLTLLFGGQRLTREWSPDERISIGAWMAAAAAAELLEPALRALVPEGRARLTPGNAESAQAAYGRAAEWFTDPAARAWFQREARAADLVARALRGVDTGDWAIVAWALETAFAETPHALAVLALAEGDPLTEARVWPPSGWTAVSAAPGPADDPAGDPSRE